MIIWLASYPRSGNTFLRVILNTSFELKTLSVYGDAADIAADEKTSRVVGHEQLRKDFDIQKARADRTLYLIKTHELPNADMQQDKVIYLLRDGRESSLSYQKYLRDFQNQNSTVLDVINGDVWGGSWGAHVQAWNPRHRDKTLLIQFERLTADPQSQIDEIARFIDRDPVSREIPTFRELNSINAKFFRTGSTDSWKNAYSELEHNVFWLANYRLMFEYGYTNHIPKLFTEPDNIAMLRDLIEQEYKRRVKLEIRAAGEKSRNGR